MIPAAPGQGLSCGTGGGQGDQLPDRKAALLEQGQELLTDRSGRAENGHPQRAIRRTGRVGGRGDGGQGNRQLSDNRAPEGAENEATGPQGWAGLVGVDDSDVERATT